MLKPEEWKMLFAMIGTAQSGMKRSYAKTDRPEFKSVYEKDMELAEQVRAKLWAECHKGGK